MNRSLKLSMLLALALGSSHAMALDLGQVQVKSSLGEPLLAEIPLHPAHPAELQNLTVQLASNEDFARAGIVGGRTTIPLHFSVAKTAGGQSVIRITSSVSVDDPYLDLLLQVKDRAGTSVREFAILLDPPGSHSTASAAPAAVAAPAPAAASRPVRRAAASAAPRPSRVTGAAPAPAPAAAAAATGQYGPVQRGQTLSSIAHATAPAGVDISQMLVALKQANPDAFYRDNINALKTGAVLRVPTATEAQTMAVAAAMAEVRRQNSDWRAGPVGKPATVADAATRASTSSSPGSAAIAPGDRLALLPAKAGSGLVSGAGPAGGKGDSSVAGLRQDLLRTRESLASLQQQSSDLKTRLKDMADINSKNKHLLSLKDSEIAELQSKLAAARRAPASPASAASAAAARPAVAASAPTQAVATLGPAVAGTSAASAASTAASAASSASTSAAVATAAPAVATTAKPAAAEPAPKPLAAAKPAAQPVSDQPWYMQSWAWAVGAGALLILLLLAALGRRKRAPRANPAPSLADRFGGPTPAVAFDGDDIDQDELLDQLAEHPENIDLHLELVTLYYSRRDVERFEAAAEAMHAHITDPQQDEWQDVLHMGEDLVPGHPLFDHHAPLPAQDEADARHPFDLDEYAAGSDTPPVVAAMPPLPAQPPKKVSEYHYDFNLTAAAPPAVAADSDKTMVAPLVPPPPAPVQAPAAPVAAEPSWRFGESGSEPYGTDRGQDPGEFNDDPVDTKLDLARAYLDMGDADGARAMLGEVLKEGSQMQQDTAKRLLDTLH